MANIVITKAADGIEIVFNDESNKFGTPRMGLVKSNIDLEDCEDLCIKITTNAGRVLLVSHNTNPEWGQVDTVAGMTTDTHIKLWDELYKLIQ